ncbi:unnamed protein product [Symbiodinium sp. CCMP2592]|nr:unnamed protein product [Symbiodinium sp. CCMP2592]CAE7483333.1 unnamed protein product [Symbiodinium sp. CCMP2592]
MIKGDGPPPSPKRRAGGRSEPSQGSKRGGRGAPDRHQANPRGGTRRGTDQHQADPRGGTRKGTDQHQADRTQEEAALGEEVNPMSIRMVKTVDAEWSTTSLASTEQDPEMPEVGPDDKQSPKHITTENADQPPDLDPETLQEYDDMAEVEEIERLIGMGVLIEPIAGEEAELLSTTFATTWKGEKGTWWRRARLVARRYRWANNVEQPADAPVVVDAPLSYVRRYGPKRWKLGRILPDQRRGAQEWFVPLNVDLEKQGLEAMIEVPTLYRAKSPEERKAAQVHVDDAMMTGDLEVVNPLLDSLGKVYTIKVNGPFYPGDEFEFLKRRFRIEADGSITVRAAAHFYIDIFDLLEQPRLRQTPGPVGDLFMVDDSEQLGPGEATLFRTVVGKLLYIAGERPDLQVVIQFLAGHFVCSSTWLAGFMKATEGHGVNFKATKGASIMNFDASGPYGKHLVEAVSDSNFATDRNTRKSLSSGHVYIDKCLMFSFVRSQKVVTLSSGEAEPVALTQTVGESILIHKAWEFLMRAEADHVARTDSSVARAISIRLGVGRVKHLQTSSLWIQQWVHKKMLKVAAIGTSKNPTDMGTKILSASRLRMLSGVAGMVNDGGEHLGADELNEELRKTSGLNTRTLKMVQLLLATSLQGCSPTDGGTVVFFLVELFGENPAAAIMVFLLAAFLAAMVGRCLASVRWHVSIHIGQGSDQGLEHGYVHGSPSHGGAQSTKETQAQNAEGQQHTKDQRDTSHDHYVDYLLKVSKQRKHEKERGEARGEGETGPSKEVARPSAEAGPSSEMPRLVSAAGSSMDPPRVHVRPRGQRGARMVSTIRGPMWVGDLDLEKPVEYAPNFGYSYHRSTCSSFRRSARRKEPTTTRRALEAGLYPCEQCCGDDHVALVDQNAAIFDMQPKRKRR